MWSSGQPARNRSLAKWSGYGVVLAMTAKQDADTAWTEAKVQQMIDDEIEENSMLDYKAAGSLGKQNNKKVDITKDVSAMANSAGGLIVYGVSEFPKPKNHIPEKVDPIARGEFPKEWLEQVISTIRPRVQGITIHPVTLSKDELECVYVVEIPQGSTAHQARDHKYYRRFNFESVSMEDHEIRDVLARSNHPKIVIEASVERSVEERDPARGGGLIETFRLVLNAVNKDGTAYVGTPARLPLSRQVRSAASGFVAGMLG